MQKRCVYIFCKRIIDLLVALMLLVILSPVMIVAALAIKLSSPGEIIFKQQRLGLHGKVFYMYKFRSMVSNAENIGSGMFLEKDDPRITGVGKFLRKTSIDELPQLLNVLRGEMSLVGPRPAPLYHLGMYDERQLRRLEVKPGMTGWAQINGRVALYWPERIELDVWYVEHMGLWLDLKILLLTLPAVIGGSGVVPQEDRRRVDPFVNT
jgi:exopolysaccharide biosynthesis polyprenyl glycosylphosphotransferase